MKVHVIIKDKHTVRETCALLENVGIEDVLHFSVIKGLSYVINYQLSIHQD